MNTGELKADYCIAGAGIAGIILATKLASSGKQILLLDQGPRYSEKDRSDLLQASKNNLNDSADYNDNLSADAITETTYSLNEKNDIAWKPLRLFGVGGTALHFNGTMMRPIQEDLQVKSMFGYGRDWPISYNEIEPWLLKAEYEIGIAGNEDNPYASKRSGPFPLRAHEFSYYDKSYFGPALKKLNIIGHSYPRSVNSAPYNGRSQCLACRACRFCPSGARYSPDRTHIPVLDSLGNVTILENISLRKLETNGSGNTISVAHVIRVKDKQPLVIKAKKFIVALGGIETPRMLFLSADNRNHSQGLGNFGGQLGVGFSDHSIPSIHFDLGRHAGSRLGFPTMITDHFRINTNRPEIPTLSIRSSPAMESTPAGSLAMKWSKAKDSVSLQGIRDLIPNIVTLSAFSELEGNGTLALDPVQKDAFGDSLAKITMKITQRDLTGYNNLQRIAIEIANAMDVKHVSELSPIGSGFGYHPSGATAMANHPDEGVCDTNLKVFGLDNLYLVSNSVFPHMGSNPPTLSIVALAMRLANHLEGK